jgi:hypothetical protein
LTFSSGGPTRHGDLVFPVRVYIGQESERPDTMARAYAWFDALQDQALGDIDLGRAEVTHTFTTGFRIGEATYAEQDYVTVELTVLAHIVEAISPTP